MHLAQCFDHGTHEDQVSSLRDSMRRFMSPAWRPVRIGLASLIVAQIVGLNVWAWQQRTAARVEAARLNREPEFPVWPAALDPEADNTTDDINAWIYETHRDQPWLTIHRQWSEGFLRLLEGAQAITERDLLDSGRYPWLNGQPLAFVLLATYDHHQEHLETLII